MSSATPTFQEIIDRIREEVIMESSTNRWTDTELLEMVKDETEVLLTKYGVSRQQFNHVITSAEAAVGKGDLIDGGFQGNWQHVVNSVSWDGHPLTWAPLSEIRRKQTMLPATSTPEIYYVADQYNATAKINIFVAPNVNSGSGMVRMEVIPEARATVASAVVGTAFPVHPDINHGGFIQAVMYRVAAKIYHAGGETARIQEALGLAKMYETEWATGRTLDTAEPRNKIVQMGGGGSE